MQCGEHGKENKGNSKREKKRKTKGKMEAGEGGQ